MKKEDEKRQGTKLKEKEKHDIFASVLLLILEYSRPIYWRHMVQAPNEGKRRPS
jgi:hypothetical protein